MDNKDRITRAYKGKGGEESATPDKRTASRLPAGQKEPKTPREPASTPSTVKPSRDAPEFSLIKGGAAGLAKAAKFLVLIGQDQAAAVIRHLRAEEIELLSVEIAAIQSIDHVEADAILREFGWMAKTKGYAVEGGPEAAEHMLRKAFGEEKAREFIARAVEKDRRPFDFLADIDPARLAILLRGESLQTLALIMPYLDPKQASAFLVLVPEGERGELIKRIAAMDRVDPAIIAKVEEGLRSKAKKTSDQRAEGIDGRAALANILKNLEPGMEENILAGIGEADPELSEDIRGRLFTLDDVTRVPDKELQKELREFDDRSIALLLKGRGDGFKAKILANISSSRRSMVLDEYGILGSVRRDEAEKPAKELLTRLKFRYEKGDFSFVDDRDLVD